MESLNTNEEMPKRQNKHSGLEFRLAEGAAMKHNPILAGIVNNVWKSQIECTPEMMRRRLDSGSLFVIAYDFPTQSEAQYIREEHHIEAYDERIPIGILETIALKTGGDYNKVPNTYEKLTRNGLWTAPQKDSDTAILVDITLIETRRRNSGGEGKILIKAAKVMIPEDLNFIWTYTPNIQNLKDWHKSMGAIETGHVITSARPRYFLPDVMLMDYSRRPAHAEHSKVYH